METKYFTPDIEDLCIGFEYESLQKQQDGSEKWCFQKIIRRYDFEGDWESWLHYKIIRVPYLTKEQIEAEGWTLDRGLYKIKKSEDLFFSLEFNSESYFLEVSSFDKSNTTFYSGKNIFKGTCKDINTFRKIIKLLGI